MNEQPDGQERGGPRLVVKLFGGDANGRKMIGSISSAAEPSGVSPRAGLRALCALCVRTNSATSANAA